MRAFKTRVFAKWANRAGLGDRALATAVAEIERGLVDARLGGFVVKKRVAMPGRGKRGSVRTLIAFRKGSRAFFVYGFAKNQRANISKKELQALRLMAHKLLKFKDPALGKAVQAGELIEIEVVGDG